MSISELSVGYEQIHSSDDDMLITVPTALWLAWSFFSPRDKSRVTRSAIRKADFSSIIKRLVFVTRELIPVSF